MSETRRQLLELLANDAASGPELADQLDISRTAVWKHIQQLQDTGFDIESDSDGYHIRSVPEFSGYAVAYYLESPYQIEYTASLPSTNDRARDLAGVGQSNTIVLADRQTGGRGRLDRTWQSPSGGIWLSVLLRPSLQPAQLPHLTLAAGVAITEAAIAHGLDAGIKWPNDVLVGDDEAKLAGILTEMEAEADRVAWVIVGMGINANIDTNILPNGATSFAANAGDVDRAQLTATIVDRFDALVGKTESTLDAWREHNVTLGRRVRVSTQDETIVGKAIDIEPPGSLIIDTSSGQRTVYAGDCDHLRPV